MEAQVGPLPVSKTTEILPLSFCYNSGRNYVLNPIADVDDMAKWAIQVAMNASDITLELLGAVSLPGHVTLRENANYYHQKVSPSDPDGLNANARVMPYKNGTMTVWVEVYGHSQNTDSMFLLPQGLYIRLSELFFALPFLNRVRMFTY